MRIFLATLIGAVAGPLYPAFADTVDAAAKPYMVGGGFLAGLVLAGLAIFLIRLGLANRQIGRASATWPTTNGKILTAVLATNWNPAVGSYRVPRVRYSFAAAGQTIQASLIRPGLEQFGTGVVIMPEEYLARFPVGGSVQVHYDPANPSNAVLELGETGGMRNIFAGSIFAVLAIAALIFALWTSTLASH
ncbi:MAG TPA: DUF3592 domain-containing protein [Pseudolabrys sp.]